MTDFIIVAPHVEYPVHVMYDGNLAPTTDPAKALTLDLIDADGSIIQNVAIISGTYLVRVN